MLRTKIENIISQQIDILAIKSEEGEKLDSNESSSLLDYLKAMEQLDSLPQPEDPEVEAIKKMDDNSLLEELEADHYDPSPHH